MPLFQEYLLKRMSTFAILILSSFFKIKIKIMILINGKERTVDKHSIGDKMNGFLLLIPFFLIRFGILGLLNKEALKRAAFFAPLVGGEKVAYWIYQISNMLILIDLFFLNVKTESFWFDAGLVIYGLGILLCIASVLNFARPAKNGINRNGLYKFSRNPMYLAYFIYFLGCALLTKSLLFLAILIVFQISAHWIILSEERWCINKFGEEYKNYMNKVRRYI